MWNLAREGARRRYLVHRAGWWYDQYPVHLLSILELPEMVDEGAIGMHGGLLLERQWLLQEILWLLIAFPKTMTANIWIEFKGQYMGAKIRVNFQRWRYRWTLKFETMAIVGIRRLIFYWLVRLNTNLRWFLKKKEVVKFKSVGHLLGFLNLKLA